MTKFVKFSDAVKSAIIVDSSVVGSDFDDFLREEGILEEVTEAAKERVNSFLSSVKNNCELKHLE
jgi:hypothetical protein